MASKFIIPDKYTKSGKSFIKKISGDIDQGSMSSFCAFPQNVSFNGKNDKEEVILLVRQAPASLISQFLTIFVFLAAPFFFFMILSAMDVSGLAYTTLGLGATIIFILLGIGTAVDTVVKWYFTVHIVTDQRIVDVDFNNVLYHRFSEAQLEQIQDVTHTVNGLWGSLFDYGTVDIQTAASRREFEFTNIPRPRDAQDVLLDLLELKQKGVI